jgi:diacylglycerol kinase family enzyme
MKKSKISKALVLVNRSANNGTAAHWWPIIKSEVLQKLPPNPIILQFDNLTESYDLSEVIKKNNINCVISVGGDGTLNLLLNNLIVCNELSLSQIHIGAIGLGSSNDFLKPEQSFISKIPIRLNSNNSTKSDIGKVTFTNENREEITRYFIINASLGATAEANFFFNTGDKLLNFLKRKVKNLAILYAAIRSIFLFKNFKATLITNIERREIKISNLGIIKNPFVSGSFRYDQAIKNNDGRLGLNYCHDMNIWELLKTLFDLALGKFSGSSKRVSYFTKSIRIKTDKIIPLETDGEVFLGTNFKFSIIPRAINTLGS